MNRLLSLTPVFVVLAFVAIVFSPFFLQGKLPIPADTIVGLYHPFSDVYREQYPSGVPYKNFLISDSVRQQYPWRQLAVEQLKNGESPKWNPYNLSGTPLLPNLQAAVYYPINLLHFFTNDFPLSWSWQIILQPILGGLFMILFLRGKKLQPLAICFGTIAWIGSGFFLAWLESNNLVQVALWLPLQFLGIDYLKKKSWVGGIIILSLSLSASFLGGALQIFLYTFLATFAYALLNIKTLFGWFTALIISGGLTYPQWSSLITLLNNSTRSLPPTAWQNSGYFLPWQNLIQFLAPDFFGNPATLNYFGIWNYMEFVGYIGLIPLVFALLALASRIKGTIFFAAMLVVSLVLSLISPLAQLPYILQIPIFSNGQPTRLLVLADFSLAVLAAYGVQRVLTMQSRQLALKGISLLVLITLGTLLVVAYVLQWDVSFSNLRLPVALALIMVVAAFLMKLPKKNLIITGLLLITLLDQSRFFMKFESFSPREWLYPKSEIITFLQNNQKVVPSRVSALDDRIMAPNFSAAYKVHMPSGYDSFFLKDYASLLSDIEGTTDFNRMILPKNYHHPLFPLLNVRYLLSLNQIDDPNLELVMTEGETHLYETSNYLPRAYFAQKLTTSEEFNPMDTTLVSGYIGPMEFPIGGSIDIQVVDNNRVTITTQSEGDNFLVLLDAYYPDWKVTIDGKQTRIYKTNFAFRGVSVPAGNHTIVFYND